MGNSTRVVTAGGVAIGGGRTVPVQSMCATRTRDVKATLSQIELLQKFGADLIRVAVDSKRDVEALRVIRGKTEANLVVDLQENYRLVEAVAPLVQKIRYNPGHLHHHQTDLGVKDKVKFIVECAANNNCAIRIGVNFGSLDPGLEVGDSKKKALDSAGMHAAMLEDFGFYNFVVSLKSSDPNAVIDINEEFSRYHPEIPLHLGVTEAGMLPMGEVKSRVALESLLSRGIGDTLRVSLTLPAPEKYREVVIGRQIVEDVRSGNLTSDARFLSDGLNIVSCPSCSRVENSAFVELAEKVREMTSYAKEHNITIAVMGCRVNGPGESDDADLGLWCAAKHVNFKRKGVLLGSYSYGEILPRLKAELDHIISELPTELPTGFAFLKKCKPGR